MNTIKSLNEKALLMDKVSALSHIEVMRSKSGTHQNVFFPTARVYATVGKTTG